MIRVLIVDDEPLAREALRDLLLADGAFAIEAECDNGNSAIAAIERAHPDAVFLDIQMPVIDGFAVIEAIGVERMPAVVFVTAYDQYALRAFESQALDYILKPFDEDRVRRVLARLKRHNAASPQLNALLRDLRPESANRLAIRTAGRTVFVHLDEVRWFEASGNHVHVHTSTAAIPMRETIKHLEARLDPDRFVRIHRSTIVNADHVREIRPWYTGEYIVVLRDGHELTLSRGCRANLPRLRRFAASHPV